MLCLEMSGNEEYEVKSGWHLRIVGVENVGWRVWWCIWIVSETRRLEVCENVVSAKCSATKDQRWT